MRKLLLLLLLLLVGYISCADLTPGNWASCQDGQERSASQTITTARVEDLRSKMQQKTLEAYIIPSGNAHLSEFVSDFEKRRQYISGFTGSSGTAVVTMTSAALWTDGRYFLQAEAELGCDWILMREGEPGVPTIVDWIAGELDGSSSKTAGASSFFFGNDEWKSYMDLMGEKSIKFYAIQPDLIDAIWTSDRPAFPSTTINALPLKYAGVTWQTKVSAVKQDMEKHEADLLIITALDETAWLFNMRATDIQGVVNDPFFYSVAIIRRDSKFVKLYIHNGIKKLDAEPTDPATKLTLKDHLNVNDNGTCAGMSGLYCVEVVEYDWPDILRHIRYVANSANIKRVWISYHTSYAVFDSIPERKVYVKNTPAAMMKARKNAVEVRGMKNANIRDTVALARFMAKLEGEVRYDNWTEVSAMEELSRFRSMQDLNRGNSFTAISSVGPHAAINHYFASNKTDRPITTTETYLLDSGGQYLDGTTDVTRTFLFREPNDFEKECYTRVLMGQINLAMAKWSQGLYGREIDAFARGPLWDVGLVYRHGTGHGIGHYLSVHEGPGRISNYHKQFVWDVPLEVNMFFSDEPGYYQDGEFGFRLENLVYVKKVKTKYSFPGSTMLGMETITFFPYEPHLINTSIMSEEQLAWVNEYHKETLNKLGPMLKAQGDEAAYDWVKKRTAPLRQSTPSAGSNIALDSMALYGIIAMFLFDTCRFH